MRIPFVGGNWKMNTDAASGRSLALAVAEAFVREKLDARLDTAVFPPFVYLREVAGALRERASKVMLGAQDVYFEKDGAFTGEVSAAMLRDCGVQVVLAGHSERRHVLGESDDIINRKARAVLDSGLACILCVGETLSQRESGQTDAVNERQVRAGLAGVKHDQMSRVTIAYEPVWAIGTGRNATPRDAQDAQAKVRRVLESLYGRAIAESVRIQYGGSVQASNAAELAAQPDIDGFLVGGASLNADEFVAILRAAAA